MTSAATETRTSTVSFDRAFGLYRNVSDEECAVRIKVAREKLGKDVVLLVHHYQRPDIYKYADLTGDSLKLSGDMVANRYCRWGTEQSGGLRRRRGRREGGGGQGGLSRR